MFATPPSLGSLRSLPQTKKKQPVCACPFRWRSKSTGLWATELPQLKRSDVNLFSAKQASPVFIVARCFKFFENLFFPFSNWRLCPAVIPPFPLLSCSLAGESSLLSIKPICHGFRRNFSFPSKPPGAYRVLVFVDWFSLLCTSSHGQSSLNAVCGPRVENRKIKKTIRLA